MTAGWLSLGEVALGSRNNLIGMFNLTMAFIDRSCCRQLRAIDYTPRLAVHRRLWVKKIEERTNENIPR